MVKKDVKNKEKPRCGFFLIYLLVNNSVVPISDISTSENKHIIYDIPNGLFIFEKLDTLYRMKLEETEEFYTGSNVCKHCNSFYDRNENKCPNCGAPREE